MTQLTETELVDLSTSTTELLQTVGESILKRFRGSFEIHFKGQFDMVTEIDLAAEKTICDALKILTPDIPVLAEESFDPNRMDHLPLNPDSTFTWILDPIDGTTNFAHGFPHFAISLALFDNQSPVFGIIHDPSKDETFSAIKNHGFKVNGNTQTVSDASSLEESLVATGFPYKVRELKTNNLMEFCSMRLHCQGVRRFGSAALDLAYVAAGRLDGFWERWLKPWDTAAGILMVAEAGGKVTRIDGHDFSIFNPDIVATNARIHAKMVELLNGPLPDLPEFNTLF